MNKPTKESNLSRGFTLIEAMITMGILIIAFSGFATLQVIGVQSNYFGDRLIQASALATDLAENIERWSYTDSRLTPQATLTGASAMSSTAITGTWNLGTRSATSYRAQYSDLANDTNASNPGALGTNFQGLSSDVNGDGIPDFFRYWNVYAIDLANSGTPNGLFIQIIVRWKQPGFGYRQVTASKFKRNPTSVF
jgi:Tfp pilus assembly protein PilV